MSYLNDPNTGWNSGARSAETHPGNCQATFSVPPDTQGAVIGLRRQKADYGYTGIEHALYFSAAGVVVMESGTAKTTAAPFAVTDTFTVRRVGSGVAYLKNGVVFYMSATPSTGPVFLDTSLYNAGDQIL